MNKIKITLKKSVIGCTKKLKNTVKSLGLKKINDIVIKNFTLDIKGKINKISHLIKVQNI